MSAPLTSIWALCQKSSGRAAITRQRPKKFQLQTRSKQKFHSTPIRPSRRKGDGDVKEAKQGEGASQATQAPFTFSIDDLDPDERADFENRSAEGKEKFIQEAKSLFEHFASPEVDRRLQGRISSLVQKSINEAPHVEFEHRRPKPGFFNYGEDDPMSTGEDDDFEGDDLSELGHAELDRHREMRHYARLAAWEMPMLSKLAKPFEPPNQDEILRFRYTTYLGEEHPAAKKIVVEFCTKDLPKLTEAQRIKLIKLVGSRYNPETDTVKMSCESFETQAQNKRYLGDLVDTLLTEARDTSDMFEDVPLDFRHHKFKRTPQFPEEWKMTEERQQQLVQDRELRLEAQNKEINFTGLIDGTSIIEQAMAALPKQEAQPVLVEQGRRAAPRKGGRPMLR